MKAFYFRFCLKAIRAVKQVRAIRESKLGLNSDSSELKTAGNKLKLNVNVCLK